MIELWFLFFCCGGGCGSGRSVERRRRKACDVRRRRRFECLDAGTVMMLILSWGGRGVDFMFRRSLGVFPCVVSS